MKKRIFSLLLTICMVLPALQAVASAADKTSDSSAFGELNLTIKQPMAASNAEFSVELYRDGGKVPEYSEKIIPTGSSDVVGSVSGIAKGTYSLKLTAANHIPYEQELTFDNDGINLTLYNAASVNDERSGDSMYGVMAIGDVNGDGKIDDADADAVTDAIERGDVKYDLNGDGETDITDLAYVVRNYTDKNVEAIPVHTVSSIALQAAVNAEINEETTTAVVQNSLGESVTADVKDVLLATSENYVSLAPKGDAPISEANPVEVSLTLDDNQADTDHGSLVESSKVEAITIVPPANSKSLITDGAMTIECVDEDGLEILIEAPLSKYAGRPAARARMFAARSSSDRPKEVLVESDGSIVINIGKRVAIKKITIQVTGTTDGKLADIAKVEFLGNFEERIPEPNLSIPKIDESSITNTEGEHKQVTVSWDRQNNVTGYEVSISGKGYSKTGVTSSTSYTFPADSFNGSPAAFEDYTLMVRSVNGDWKSGWSDPVVYTIKCTSKPKRPEYLSVTPGVQSLKVSWRALYDTQTWSLFYKSETDESYTEIKNLSTSSYSLNNLTGGVKYTFYVMGHNINGSSPASAFAEGVPQTATGVEMPRYKLININDEDGRAMTHIESIEGVNNKSYTIYKSDGSTVTNSSATADDWTSVADNDPSSYLYINDWDSGVAYPNFRGPIVRLDARYMVDTIRIAPSEGASVFANGAKIGYKDENGEIKVADADFYMKYDSQNRRYHEIVTREPIKSDYFEIRLTTGYSRGITLSEIKLYMYDSLEDDVEALFEDEMRTYLKSGVTKEQIEKLIDRADTPGEFSGELHPHRDTILADLNYAMKFLDDGSRADVIKVDTKVTSRNDRHLGFAQSLSDYQPLGYVAAAKDTVVIYVSSPTKNRGTATSLNLVVAQYHPEVSSWSRSAQTLLAGRNEIQIPAITSAVKEKGGSLYVQYTGSPGAEEYDIRVSGSAYKIPTLNADGLKGDERSKAIGAYVKELGEYVDFIEDRHNEVHLNSSNDSAAYEYNEKECFFNSTEIVMGNIFYSFPATQVWRGINNDASKTADEELSDAVDAIEQEVKLFYQFKGLNENAGSDDTDRFPNGRLNIRYHQMFTGAFMYAGGKHIGIEYGSVGGLFDTSPIQTDENGKRLSGRYSGWGIAHEIGHCINSAAYQRVEVTNNVFASLAQTDETNKTFRGAYGTSKDNSYDSIYKAVASGTTGHSGNVFVQLAMYWQLHLAYDDGYSYKFYDTAEEQKENLFYARLDSYLRNTSKAPETNIPLTLNGNSDNNLMRAACAAAEKDILFFFEAWGLSPDENTRAYASQFEKETRKIQYIDDDSRLYRMESGEGMSGETVVSAKITNAENNRINDNKVKISLSNNNKSDDAMLGYEITRNGKVVAFVRADKTEYTDVIATENNRAFVYTVTGIDRNLKETETVTLGEVKVCHDGAIDKSGWAAVTNMNSAKDSVVEKDESDPESGSMSGNATPGVEKISAIDAAVDNDPSTVYYGVAGTGVNRPNVSLYLGRVEQVTAVKITPASEDYDGDASDKIQASELYKHRIFGYKIEVSLNGTDWTVVKEGNAYTGSAANPDSWIEQDDVIYNDDGSYTLFFNKTLDDGTMDPFMYTYDASYIRITATNMSGVAIAELDVLGPTNDNIELIDSGFGRLSEDFVYGDGSDDEGNAYKIPKGAVVFYGSYKGDPSYNVVELRDQNNVILGGSQIILADVPEKGALGETSDGRWFFWFETEAELAQLESLKTVQAELYRVDEAMTLEGERMTSNTLHFALPSEYPEIKIVSETTNIMRSAPARNVNMRAYKANYAALFSEISGTEIKDEVSQPRVSLSATGNKVEFTSNLSNVSVAMSSSISLDNIDSSIYAAIEWSEADDDVYRAYRYGDGKLNIYAVSKRGYLDDSASGIISLGGTPTIGKRNVTFSAERLKELDGSFVITENKFASSAVLTVGEDLKYVLKFNVNGGTAIESATENEGTVIDLSKYSTAREGYDFTGWYSDEKLTEKITSIKLTADTTVYAGWNEKSVQPIAKFALKFNVNGGTEVGTITESEGTVIDLSKYSTAREGYDFTGWYSDEKLTEKITSIKLTADTTIYAGWNEKTVNNPFIDLKEDSYYFDSVLWAVGKGITNGISATTFEPESTCTRGQLVTFLWRALGSPKPTSDSNPFDDVKTNSFYYNAVLWAVENDITNGVDDSHFNPDQDVTRAHTVTFLWRAAGKPEISKEWKIDFTDLVENSYYSDAVVWAAEKGITNGTSATTFEPEATCVRAQIVTFLHRFDKIS